MRTLAVRAERWPIAGRFTISRGSKTAGREEQPLEVVAMRSERFLTG
jgi:hypothetical protein